jgi:hypothetical protein
MMIFYLSIVLVLQLDEFRPKVGDIVVFRPASQNSIISQMTVPASATSFHGAECSLDPNVMAEERNVSTTLIQPGSEFKLC